MGKVLILLGIVATIMGILLVYKIPIPFLGRLPGDLYIKGENYQFYFPITTSLILSFFLSILFYIFSKF